MSSNKLFVQNFRKNDLKDNTGVQIEFGKEWLEFLEIEDSKPGVTINLVFKPLSIDYEDLNNKEIALELSNMSGRGDRKTYANGSNTGHSALKEFFLYDLHLTEDQNLNDYFAIYKASELNYFLYYIPKLLYDNFIKLFESTSPNISKGRTYSKEMSDDKQLQKIFFGSPGTSKSHTVKELVDDNNQIHFRTTFHPDSDYSTFVGCYKPRSHKKNLLSGNGINETQLLSCFFNSNGSEYKGKNKARYLYEALVHTKDIRDLGLDAQMVSDKLNAQGFTGCAYTTEATCMYNIYDWLKEDGYIVENKLSYEFTPQAFVNAYVEAWRQQKSGTPVYLIIEEINRGNCAQIFGDLFQLLDRDDKGFSRYEVTPDSDLQDYIASLGLNISDIVDRSGNDISSKISRGELLKLPDNFFIWATMNTSDQSLFPIDSAFKRRWDWKYMPIEDAGMNWEIHVNGNTYNWYDFLVAINKEVLTLTHSEDKQLGYFFAKAKNNIIDAETLVNKVYFYLWTDVFKDYDYESQKAFRKPNSTDPIAFKDFFIGRLVNEKMAEQVLINLELNKPEENAE